MNILAAARSTLPLSALTEHARQQLPARAVSPGSRIALALPLLLGAIILLSGCGSTGSPQAPSLKLPVPPADLSVIRAGDSVLLHWTMPRRATDRVPLVGDQRAVICRSVGPASSVPCTQVGTVLLQAGLAASYTDSLPPSLTTGPPRLLTYMVLLENYKHRGAGPSNKAFTAAGAAPPAIAGLRAETGPSGIVLRWEGPETSTASPPTAGQPAAAYLLRLERTRILAAGESTVPASEESRTGTPQPLMQTLEVPLAAWAGKSGTLAYGWLLDHAIDQDAALNRTYRYTVERVARLTLDGHAVEVTSPASAPATLLARDLFPPAVPQGPEAVADVVGGAIDLSWTADADADLAGYYVYRRVVDLHAAGKTALLARVSGPEPLPNSAWRDPSTRPGVRYAYSVSAIDTSGNESTRSAEVEEQREAATPAVPAPPGPASTPTRPHP